MQELNAAYEVLKEGAPTEPWRPAPQTRRRRPAPRRAAPPAPAPRRQPPNRRDQRIAEVAAAAYDRRFPTRNVDRFVDELYQWRARDWPWNEDSRRIELGRLVVYAAELAVDHGGPIKTGYFQSHDGSFYRTSCYLPYVEPTREDVGTIPEILWRFRQWVEEGANPYHVAWVELDGRPIAGTPNQPCPGNRHTWGGYNGPFAWCGQCGLNFVVERDDEGFPEFGTARRLGEDERDNPYQPEPPELMIERGGRPRSLVVQTGPLPPAYAEVAVRAGLRNIEQFLASARSGDTVDVSATVAERLWDAFRVDRRFTLSSTLAFWRIFWPR